MFGSQYFGRRYFGDRYFGKGIAEVIIGAVLRGISVLIRSGSMSINVRSAAADVKITG